MHAPLQQGRAPAVSQYPDHATYRALYLRYLQGRGAHELLELLQPLTLVRFLDLCCGEGQLTRGAIEANVRHAFMVDAEPKMLPLEERLAPLAQMFPFSVERALDYFRQERMHFERVACRQAVNYWLDERTARSLFGVMTPKGVFAFNTFNEKPPEKPRVLEYELEGHHFTEVSWLVGEDVHHVQVRSGLPPHRTTFKWISPERFREILDPFFEVEEIRKGKSSLYRCIAKK